MKFRVVIKMITPRPTPYSFRGGIFPIVRNGVRSEIGSKVCPNTVQSIARADKAKTKPVSDFGR